jgi:integration host factor subunit alpha
MLAFGTYPKQVVAMNFTRAEITESISMRCGHPRRRSIEIFETMVELIEKSLESGEDVLISGFGRFRIKDTNGRGGRKPRTHRNSMPEPRREVTFKCSSVLKKKLNGVTHADV